MSCPKCQTIPSETDLYCRVCGRRLSETSDYAMELHQTIVETLPVGLFVVDGGGRVRFWNRAMEEHSGARRRDTLGRLLVEALPHLRPYTHAILRVFDTALPLTVEQVSYVGRNGAELLATVSFHPIILPDDAPALLGTLEDITGRVRVDNQLIRSERLAAIGELAAGVAHNFNNILAAIGGDAQLLEMMAQEEHLPPHVTETANKIHQETMRGGRIAHDLLSFARGGDPAIRSVDVRELVHDVTRLVSNHPAARGATIELNLPEKLAQVEADPNQLHQVFFNLMLNALQAMPNGGILSVDAVVRGHEEDPTLGILDVKFHDTGVGIPREQQRRIFDPFYSRRAGGASGSGLGLPVSLAMVKSLGGDIQITSAEGIGATVTVSLPIVERRTAARGKRERGGRALVIDDEPDIGRTLTALLTRYGYEVTVAASAEEGLACAEAAAFPFHFVVTELSRRRSDGCSVVKLLRERCRQTPIIALTASTEVRALREALEEGAQFSFGKPPNFTELLAVIESLAAPAAEPEPLAAGGA